MRLIYLYYYFFFLFFFFFLLYSPNNTCGINLTSDASPLLKSIQSTSHTSYLHISVLYLIITQLFCIPINFLHSTFIFIKKPSLIYLIFVLIVCNYCICYFINSCVYSYNVCVCGSK